MPRKAIVEGVEAEASSPIAAVIVEAGFEPVLAESEEQAFSLIDSDPEIRCAVFLSPGLSHRCISINDKFLSINAERLRVYPVFALRDISLDDLKERIATGLRLIHRSDAAYIQAGRCSSFRNTLFRLSSMERNSLEEGFSRITEETARELGVERCSIWLFSDDLSKIVCHNSYYLSDETHGRPGSEIKSCDYPGYFDALHKTRSINAADAARDPRTCELAESYLIPERISSMLDTLIISHGRAIGVLCAEHIGQMRQWSPDEQEFAISMSDLVSIEIEADRRDKAETELERLNKSLEGELLKRSASLFMEKAKYEAILKAASEVAVIAMDTGGTITMFNPGAEKMFGYGASEVEGHHSLVLFHRREDLLRRVNELSTILGRRIRGLDVFLEIPRTEGYELSEWVAIRKNGEILHIQLAVTPIRGTGGEISGYLGIGTDVSTLRKAHEEIRALSRQNQMILESVAEGIYGVDASASTVFINPAAERMLGFSAKELLGSSSSNLLRPVPPEGDRPHAGTRVESKIEATLRDGVMRRSKNESLSRKDGSLMPVEYSVSPLFENGAVAGAVVVFQDISEMLRQEKDRLRMEVELRQAQKLEAIGQLAAGIAHEINTPVQYIGDNLSFLQDSFQTISTHLDNVSETAAEDNFPKDAAQKISESAASADINFIKEEAPKALAQSIEGAARIAEIVLAMKEFSHPGSAEKTFVNINKAIMTTVTISRNEWKYVAELTTDLLPTLPTVPCLPGEMNQVFLNIIVNAAHAIGDIVGNSGKKGQIKIQTLLDGDMVEIRISDTGSGIPDNIKDRIFDPFFTTKGVGKGTGQGLPIARSIVVQKHAGQLLFESALGKGTTFIIRLPLKEGKADKQEAQPDS